MSLDAETTILAEYKGDTVVLTLNRVAKKNSIDEMLLAELHHQLDLAEQNEDCRVLVLQGQEGIFSSGMDFSHLLNQQGDETKLLQRSDEIGYARLLRRITESSIIFISAVDGDVMAGGVGIVAASDLVFATPRSFFRLTEAMWGLIPANVTPYLIRRIGFQPAFRMAITLENVSASEAKKMNLVDFIAEDLEKEIKKKRLMLRRIESQTVGELKQFFRSQWFASEDLEREADKKMRGYANDKKLVDNLNRYVHQGLFPWE